MNPNPTPNPCALKNAVFCACHEFLQWLEYIYENKERPFDFSRRVSDAYRLVNERYNAALSFLFMAHYVEPFERIASCFISYRSLLETLSEYADGFKPDTPEQHAEHVATLPKLYAQLSDTLLDVPRLGVYSTEGDAINAAPDGVAVYRFDRQILAYIVDLDGVLTPDNNFKIVER